MLVAITPAVVEHPTHITSSVDPPSLSTLRTHARVLWTNSSNPIYMYLYSSPEPLNGAHGQGKSEVKVGEDVIVVWYARVSFSNQFTPHNHLVPSLSILE